MIYSTPRRMLKRPGVGFMTTIERILAALADGTPRTDAELHTRLGHDGGRPIMRQTLNKARSVAIERGLIEVAGGQAHIPMGDGHTARRYRLSTAK